MTSRSSTTARVGRFGAALFALGVIGLPGCADANGGERGPTATTTDNPSTTSRFDAELGEVTDKYEAACGATNAVGRQYLAGELGQAELASQLAEQELFQIRPGHETHGSLEAEALRLFFFIEEGLGEDVVRVATANLVQSCQYFLPE